MNITKLLLVALLLPALTVAQVVPGTRTQSLKSTNPDNSAARTAKDGKSQTAQKKGRKPGDAHNAAGASQKSDAPKMKANRHN